MEGRSLAKSGRLFYLLNSTADISFALRLQAAISVGLGVGNQSSVIGHQVQGVSAQGGAGTCSGCNAKG
ncbi:hypothetical protein [Nostoc sp.]|uniref:hypothetical protein n=1 Tax=Nostoc sp. TaxID=1180 RepID=UPI002FF79AC2